MCLKKLNAGPRSVSVPLHSESKQKAFLTAGTATKSKGVGKEKIRFYDFSGPANLVQTVVYFE